MASSSSLHIVWLDINVYRDVNRTLLEELRKINCETTAFTDRDECLQYIRRGLSNSYRFVFIVSGAIGETLVPEIHEIENIASIYVYCGHIFKHEGWSRQYEKVTVVTTDEEVLKGVRSDHERFR